MALKFTPLPVPIWGLVRLCAQNTLAAVAGSPLSGNPLSEKADGAMLLGLVKKFRRGELARLLTPLSRSVGPPVVGHSVTGARKLPVFTAARSEVLGEAFPHSWSIWVSMLVVVVVLAAGVSLVPISVLIRVSRAWARATPDSAMYCDCTVAS